MACTASPLRVPRLKDTVVTVTHHQSYDTRASRLSGRVSLVTEGNIGVADDCRRGIRGRYALISMCIGGGPGIAAIFKRV